MRRTSNTGKYEHLSRFCVPVDVQERNVKRELIVGYIIAGIAFVGLIALYVYAFSL